MTRITRYGGLALLCMFLAACSLPRGAGFETEVLAAAVNADGERQADFGVEPVTRAFLERYDSWPAVGESNLRWIGRTAQEPNRIIAAGDKIAVTIWNTEENSLLTSLGQRFVRLEDITVSSSGSVFLPYVETVRIAGMSPERARETLQDRYIDIIPSAQVQLELIEGRQNTVNAVQGVSGPGTYPLLDQDYTIMALLADAGGVQPGITNPQIRLIRGNDIYGTSMDRLLENPSLDTTLRGGDRVFVEADERFFLSLGATGQEAIHEFPRDRVTALEALAIVGGIADARADPQGILVLRRYPVSALRSDGTGPAFTRTVFTLDLTSADGLFSAGQFLIRNGDLVYATESPVTTAQTVFGLIGAGFNIVDNLGNI